MYHILFVCLRPGLLKPRLASNCLHVAKADLEALHFPTFPSQELGLKMRDAMPSLRNIFFFNICDVLLRIESGA